MSFALIAGLMLAYSGMLGLCLGLERHFKQIWQRPPSVLFCRLLRVAGWSALAASFATCVFAWGWAMGPVGWFGLISLAGLALVLLLPYAARLSIVIAGIGWPVLGAVAFI
ncbi:DUF3325 domain-containing protein [Pseudomonas syringae]|nr:DUF3325 domain-containing protein [Pseudomonas syringae]